MPIKTSIRRHQFIYTADLKAAIKIGAQPKALTKFSSEPQKTCINIYRVGFK